MFEIKNAEDIMEAKSINDKADKVLDSLIDKLYKLLSVEDFPYRPELLNFRNYKYHLEKDLIVETETNGYYSKGINHPVIVYSFNNGKLKPEIKQCLKEGEELFLFVEFGEILFAGPVIAKRNGNKTTPCMKDTEAEKIPVHYITTDALRDFYFHIDAVLFDGEQISFESPTSKKQGFLRLLKGNSLVFDERKIQFVIKDIEAIMDRCLNCYFDI